jgi:hypothetical protein
MSVKSRNKPHDRARLIGKACSLALEHVPVRFFNPLYWLFLAKLRLKHVVRTGLSIRF